MSQQAQAHDSHHHSDEFTVGNKILVNPHLLDLVDMKGTGQKFLQQRIGPFLILEKINPAVYCLHLPTELWMCPVTNIEHLTWHNQDKVNQQTKLKDLQMLRGEVE